jgi:hypothetical protein
MVVELEKIKVKGSGQECPLHLVRVLVFRLFVELGKIKVKGSGQECPLHTNPGKSKKDSPEPPRLSLIQTLPVRRAT